ncbi:MULTISPECIES: hypothetical protein [Elizabethkingia]|uniref:hypothetical protein n=1 Tax=Elizabethkingia TaxID=308865 RepID=UPI000750E08E|nr:MULTISPECIES: hypothetical protein [Elizabethkingia]KUY27399.1 hypothetical protein ATB96_03260 [Elizabethkingia ursingii]MCL1665308.1 hypothetical protein [Elizabethkingia ursingii]OPC10066.1 hypothetical protein BAY01_14050 [Elizabethkingia miricola]
MQNDFDIDQLKNAWQKQETGPKYQDSEILEILNKKSRNYVKFIFWVSVAEFALFLILNISAWLRHENGDAYFTQLSQLGIQINESVKATFHNIYFVFKMISLFIILFYVWVFFRKYKKIDVESNLKSFILQIISFKKSVNRFILVNILFLLCFLLLITLFPVIYIQQQHIQISDNKYAAFIIGIIISCIVCVLLILLYYKLIYGILMKKLSRNLQQLKNIENEQ